MGFYMPYVTDWYKYVKGCNKHWSNLIIQKALKVPKKLINGQKRDTNQLKVHTFISSKIMIYATSVSSQYAI